MFDKYLEILNANGGTMEFPAFVEAAQAAKVDPRLWLRAKHDGVLHTWLTSDGKHMISVNPRS